MGTIKTDTVVIDRGASQIIEVARSLSGSYVTSGVQSSEGRQAHDDGGINLAELLAVHEYGARIMHPGGTPYMVSSQSSGGRSGAMSGSGSVTFLKKGDPRAIGVTRAHAIHIPERAPLRTAFKKNRRKYQQLTERYLKAVHGGRMGAKQMLDLIGAEMQKDQQAIFGSAALKPLAASTVRRRRKQSNRPLVDSGQLRNSLRYASKVVGGRVYR